jgi:hypothetical protein
LGIILISSGNIYSQTQGKKAGKKKGTEQEINSNKKPGEPVKGEEVFEEQKNGSNNQGNHNGNDKAKQQGKQQGKKQGKEKGKKQGKGKAKKKE